MTARERVLTTCQFQRPDQIPRFDHFWVTQPDWVTKLGGPEALTDIKIWVPIEGAFPTRMRTLVKNKNEHIAIDQWGATVRTRPGAAMYETLEVAIPENADIDHITFDAPDLDLRYRLKGLSFDDTLKALARDEKKTCVFGKTGGPYLRTAFVRGTEQFLMDMAGDPPLAKALADKMAHHLTVIGLEELKRWHLYDTGIWIYDDMASNKGPMFSPKSFERVLLPAYQHMIKTWKQAGARYVFLHSDGNINPLLDMLIDAGIDGLNPLEPRAGMDAVALRKKYPRTILTGGMDNTATFIYGPVARIEAEARRLIDLGRDGGLVIGTHSISPETPFEHVQAYHHTCQTYGNFTRISS